MEQKQPERNMDAFDAYMRALRDKKGEEYITFLLTTVKIKCVFGLLRKTITVEQKDMLDDVMSDLCGIICRDHEWDVEDIINDSKDAIKAGMK